MNSQFNNTLDLFEIGMFDANYYVSEKLKANLIIHDITGYSVTQAEISLP